MTDTTTRPGPEAGELAETSRPWVLIGRSFGDNKIALLGVVLVLLVIGFCFIGPLVYHTNQLQPNLLQLNQRPSGKHPLGTDYVGFDILGRLMVAGQSSIEIGLAVAVLATSFGVLWGAVSGYFGGALDSVMMRVVDIVLAIPALFIFIYLATVFRPTVVLLIIVVSALSWVGPARLVRGETLSLRVREYVQAVRVMGGSSRRMIFRHVIPNTISTIVVNATFQVADAVLILATLSFLGFGLPPPAATWGGMLTNGANYLYDGYWWEIYPAGFIIVITVVAFNFVGDGLRDALEVRLQRR
ncbi:MAG TPA: ABC transporter permease [Streptosporangiaceae bacterium]|jgi:peptide/nickel transport system permease protein|nr:ABC transporter permease [Streptosporangiaceae bacterium]